MNWITAAEDGPHQDWVHVIVDTVSYRVHSKRAEIHCESKDPSDVHLAMTNDLHRKNLCSKAAIVHRENGGWTKERPDTWSVHLGKKSLKVKWDGSLPSEKASSLANAALASVVLRKAESMSEMAMRKFSKPYEQLNPNEKAQLADEMHASNPQQAPIQNLPPSFQPMAPGQSASSSINWFRGAGDNPFEKKDDKADDKDEKKDDRSEDKKDDKKAPPFGKKDDKKDDKPADKKDDKPKDEKKDAPKKDAPKKDAPKKSPSKSDEQKDIEMADEAIEAIEKLIEREEKEGEGGPHLESLKKALEEMLKFNDEEGGGELDMMGPGGHDHAGPGMPKMIDVKPLPIGPAPKGPLPGPMNAMPGMASWIDENKTGFEVNDSVWRKSELGNDTVGLEPGRVIDVGGGKVIVDWGDTDGIPSEEAPSDLVLAEEATGEGDLFRDHVSSTNSDVEESVPGDMKVEIEKILASTSLKALMSKESSTESSPNAIVHIGTGIEGEFVAKASDGRILAKFGNEEILVMPYEVRFLNQPEEK